MNDTHMKPLLSVAIHEAVKLAIVDCLDPDKVTDEDRIVYRKDNHKIPGDLWKSIDPTALAQNICCRLLGTGGWEVNNVYAGNASPIEVLYACIQNPGQDPNGDVKKALGLGDGV